MKTLSKDTKKEIILDLYKLEEKALNTLNEKRKELDSQEKEIKKRQKDINKYLEDAKSGKTNNLTREEITDTLSVFFLSDEEIKEVAKMILFPEDSFFDSKKVIKEEPVVYEEEKKEEIAEKVNEDIKEEPEVEEKEEISKKDNVKSKKNKEIDEKEEIITAEDSLLFDTFDDIVSEITPDEVIDEDLEIKEIIEEAEEPLSSEDSDDFINAFDNIDFDNDESDLKQKKEYLIEHLGKTEEDIRLVSNILTKFKTLKDLKDAVEEKSLNGKIDVKSLPLTYLLKETSLSKDRAEKLIKYCSDKDHPEKYLTSLNYCSNENFDAINEKLVRDGHFKPSSWFIMSNTNDIIKKRIARADSLGYLDAYIQNPSFINYQDEKIVKRMSECDAKQIPYKNPSLLSHPT